MSSKRDLHPIEASPIHAKRERMFLLLAGLFLGSLTMLNILGVSRFLVLFSISAENGSWNWWTAGKSGVDTVFAIAVGVLPYPITFLCTDLIGEFYGRRRANWLVTVGLLLNFWVVFILWIGGAVPEKPTMDPDTLLPQINIKEVPSDEPSLDIDLGDFGVDMEEEVSEEEAAAEKQEELNNSYNADVPYSYAFYQIRSLAFGAVFASMIAYMLAQFADVYLFHLWRRITKGKHLWLRNNGSTLASQLIDTVAVIVITHFLAKQIFEVDGMSSNEVWATLFLSYILPSYLFKVVAALADTLPFYLLVAYLKKHLEIDPSEEFRSGVSAD